MGRASHAGHGTSWFERISEFRVGHYVDKWRQRFRTHPLTGLPLAPLRPWIYDPSQLTIEHLAFRTGRGLRLALRLFAPVTIALALVSLFWDFHGVIRTCSIAGLIGFGTNWIAVQMLFRPRESRPIFGQGLIPSQRDEIIRKVADEVVDKLINERILHQEIVESQLISRLTDGTVREIRRVMHDPEFVKDTKGVILTYAAKIAGSESFREELAHEIAVRVERAAGRSFASWLVTGLRGLWREPIARLVDQEIESLPSTLDRLVGEVDEALDHLPAYLDAKRPAIDDALTRIMMSLVREMDVRSIVLKQLSTVTSEQLETGFRDFADDKLSYITLVGGILGIVGGLLILWPLWSTLALISLGLVLTLLDIAIHRVVIRFRKNSAAER